MDKTVLSLILSVIVGIMILGMINVVSAESDNNSNNQLNICKSLYWIDNDNKDCSQKEFCGAYMYYSLQTFESKTQCENALGETTTTLNLYDISNSDGYENDKIKFKESDGNIIEVSIISDGEARLNYNGISYDITYTSSSITINGKSYSKGDVIDFENNNCNEMGCVHTLKEGESIVFNGLNITLKEYDSNYIFTQNLGDGSIINVSNATFDIDGVNTPIDFIPVDYNSVAMPLYKNWAINFLQESAPQGYLKFMIGMTTCTGSSCGPKTCPNKSKNEEGICKYSLSNGRKAEIKIMPETASERARERLGELNFTIELKEVVSGSETRDNRPVYELTGDKEGRFLGLFKTKGKIITQIDAETGEVVKTKKPWWAFLASGI
ncbi:MAG: PepSY domain-containing protein [Candidatus Pacearchaeota archaeon]|jgi:hypothetical protein